MGWVAANEQHAAEVRIARTDRAAAQDYLWKVEVARASDSDSPKFFRGLAATWHSDNIPSPDSRRFMNRCAINPMKSTESFTFSDASWDSYSAVSPTRTITWMSRTGTDRFVGTTGTIPE